MHAYSQHPPLGFNFSGFFFSQKQPVSCNNRELTILRREPQELHKTNTAIIEIKAVKLCRNNNLKDLYPNNWPHTFLKSSTIFYNVKSICFQLECELAPVFCMKILSKPDQFTSSVYRVFI